MTIEEQIVALRSKEMTEEEKEDCVCLLIKNNPSSIDFASIGGVGLSYLDLPLMLMLLEYMKYTERGEQFRAKEIKQIEEVRYISEHELPIVKKRGIGFTTLAQRFTLLWRKAYDGEFDDITLCSVSSEWASCHMFPLMPKYPKIWETVKELLKQYISITRNGSEYKRHLKNGILTVRGWNLPLEEKV